MNSDSFGLLIVLVGLVLTPLLFYQFPRLPRGSRTGALIKLSVIIPARNEADNLPLLLEDLMAQTVPPGEIIVVDDDSSDDTGKVARSFGVRVISLRHKPQGWTGKTWACHNGAKEASGEVLLFLDADVRLGQEGLARLLEAYRQQGVTLSVQPYHETRAAYEQLSLLFNLIQVAANGTTLPGSAGIGLHGPLILMPAEVYHGLGGHEKIRGSVIEDLALGGLLKKAGQPFQLYVGDQDITYRMYSDGLRSLYQGWVKNIAAGAARTPWWRFALIFLWMGSLANVPWHLLHFVRSKQANWIVLYAALYLVWVLVLFLLGRKLGRFHPLTVMGYPVVVLVTLGIFLVSLIKKGLGLRVTWKGRRIEKERKT